MDDGAAVDARAASAALHQLVEQGRDTLALAVAEAPIDSPEDALKHNHRAPGHLRESARLVIIVNQDEFDGDNLAGADARARELALARQAVQGRRRDPLRGRLCPPPARPAPVQAPAGQGEVSGASDPDRAAGATGTAREGDELVPRLLDALKTHLISQGLVRDPRTAGALPPFWRQPRLGTPAPARSRPAARRLRRVTRWSPRISAAASRPAGSSRRGAAPSSRSASARAKAPTGEDLGESILAAVIDRTNWLMGGRQIIESQMWRPLTPTGATSRGSTTCSRSASSYTHRSRVLIPVVARDRRATVVHPTVGIGLRAKDGSRPE
jgi:hypothetical protein